MVKYDAAAVDAGLERLRKLNADSTPAWGSMTAPQMFAHLRQATRYSLGKEKETAQEGNVFIRMATPLFLNGIIKFPKNSARPKLYDAAAPQATVEELEVELREFLERQDAGTLDPPPHPMLGDLKVKGWGQLHVVHLDHHARQFGV